jgi:hypothetical protein
LFAFSRESGRLLNWGLSPKLPHHEGIFFDPEARAEPVRMTRTLERSSGFEEGDPYTLIECVQTRRFGGCYLRTGSELGQKRAVEIGSPLKNALTD